MADTQDDDVLELTDVVEGDEPDTDEGHDDTGDAQPQGDDELEVTIGDEAAPASGESETALVKHLRSVIRDNARRGQAEQRSAPVELGPEPSIDDPDIDYDPDVFKAKWRAWNESKVEVERTAAAQTSTAEASARQWQTQHTAYKAALDKLPFADKADAEETVAATLSMTQQAALVSALNDPAKVVYALAKHPAKLAELSAITDPLRFVAALAKLEDKIQMKPKRAAPPAPERIATGSARVAGSTDKELERLEKEAERSGDRTKLIAHKAKLRAKAKD